MKASVQHAEPGVIQVHWVEVDGRRWPAKQVLRLALGDPGAAFNAHQAVRVLRRLGFTTSLLPNERAAQKAVAAVVPVPPPAAAAAFERVDAFFASGSLTRLISDLEHQIDGVGRAEALAARDASGLDERLVEAALVMRERVGMLDSLVHAAVITQVLPSILVDGESVRGRPSLAAGNDPSRPFDLETSHRVAEFKVSIWKGADSMRQRSLFADVVGLSLDESDRRREVYVVGDRPIRFLTTSRADAAKKLAKASLRVRQAPGLHPGITVAEFVRENEIHVMDLRELIPGLE